MSEIHYDGLRCVLQETEFGHVIARHSKIEDFDGGYFIADIDDDDDTQTVYRVASVSAIGRRLGVWAISLNDFEMHVFDFEPGAEVLEPIATRYGDTAHRIVDDGQILFGATLYFLLRDIRVDLEGDTAVNKELLESLHAYLEDERFIEWEEHGGDQRWTLTVDGRELLDDLEELGTYPDRPDWRTHPDGLATA